MLNAWLKNIAPVHSAEQYHPKPDGSYNLVEARRGRGKSYLLANIAYESIFVHGVAVKANFRCNPHRMALVACFDGLADSIENALDYIDDMYTYTVSIEDYLTAYNCVCLWDEANRTLNAYSRGKADIPPVLHDWAQQSRKHYLTLWFATQYMDWIDSRFRILFDWMYRAKVVRDKTRTITINNVKQHPPKYFNLYGSDPYAAGVGSEVVRRADRIIRLPFSPTRAGMYNSWEVIVPPTVDVRWRTFAEVADYMHQHGLKPSPPPPAGQLELSLEAFVRSSDLQADLPHPYEPVIDLSALG